MEGNLDVREVNMRLRRLCHALFGHRRVRVNLAEAPWTATCDCGFELRVTEFSLGKIGAPASER
jgi:hypothetical protein